jgi:hypothetical protein
MSLDTDGTGLVDELDAEDTSRAHKRLCISDAAYPTGDLDVELGSSAQETTPPAVCGEEGHGKNGF